VYVSEKFGGYGRVVVIKGDHLLTVYAHNSRNRVDVGDVVRKGDWIADVGQTGDASGPHVHFETRILDDSGRYAAVDPFNFISGAREVLQ
jgi:murein DD-endopeptidase MepM/ murein hydrolase activator NlpD